MTIGHSHHRNANMFQTQESIMATFTVPATVISKYIGGKNISLWIVTGNIWVDLTGSTGLTTLTGFKCNANTLIEAYVPNSLTLISDVTTGSAQIMIWQD